MKKLLLTLFCLYATWALSAQNHVLLHLAPRLGTAPFQLDVPIPAGNYQYKITRLEYYISEISILHDGGQVTPMSGLYLLVRPALDSLYDLGAQPGITSVEGITFSIGVDQAHNHGDPASYPANHPLAPQDPAMHWGWSAGYRFVAIEGVVDSNFVNLFGVHALGDANYKTLTLSTSAEPTPDGHTIHLIADYAQVLNSINVSGGLVVHGSTGEASTLLKNMKSLVFTAKTTGTIDPGFSGSFALSSNPAQAGQAEVSMDLPEGQAYQLTVTDLLGQVLQTRNLANGAQHFTISNGLPAGTYVVHLWQNGRVIVAEKMVVIQ